MSEEESNEIPVQVKSDEESEEKSNELALEKESEEQELSVEELKELLAQEKEKTAQYESKLKYALADLQNLNRKIQSDIQNGINTKIDQLMIEFLQIYDDFVRAKEVFSENGVDTEGLDSILKNMNSLLLKYGVTPIDAVGEIFNPKLHEAISIIEDPTLDENTITKELRKGYISHNRVIRPTLVEISKKPKSEKLGE
ncbi:MAG TPA: nucleotide exchange factor GrpE [Nitrosopumilaceae archaeon]|nr:nucleotide exchange factor GrpE [Nitrosopumilaceae archaeon]